ncbi:unnamed protein product [Caenorhabditis angaria]|uniref:valine--tRNA ligase n=1 Tax=Caenorhabditis angaria TaxID=860376 RepID=A0A9P1IVC1_9PELO|nr:unnamed protein product [Caenorhabditis angaria]
MIIISRNGIRRPRRCFYSTASSSTSSFNIDEVTRNYEERTNFASENYRKRGTFYRMILPPPNVTGKLHLGHALTGNIAEWIPGFDHAGIATQAVVEKMLEKSGKSRKSMSRAEFLRECEVWSDKCSSEIQRQLSRMGASLNWNNKYYTLDTEFSKFVEKTFCRLYKEELIYRGERIVHWCPKLGSTLSSQEVDKIDIPENGIIQIGNRKISAGKMHNVKYYIDGSEEYIIVGTTRPETIFADIAIAVHPNDPRYNNIIGKSVINRLIPNRKLLIIADEAVLMNKGTGAVKITPYHDPLDFEIYQRHESNFENSSIIECIDKDGKMKNTGIFDGLDRFEGREKTIEQLKLLESYSGIDETFKSSHVNICSRTGDIIEPRLMEQWFMDVKDMYQRSKEAIETGKIKIFPEYQSHRLIDWFENQEPWCLSRQLLWGHRIPAYYKNLEGKWIVAENIENEKDLVQDEDVLDTWFSSSLVPLIKNNSPQQNPSLQLMETGWDISGFWVSRMIGMSLKLTNDVPFSQVVLHGLVRDSEGRKMSKSLGNVIDPLDILDGIKLEDMIKRLKESALGKKEIELAIADTEKRFPEGIRKCGPDALRFALLKYDILSSDIPLDISNVALEGLKFCNKLWNLAAYYEQLSSKCEVIKDVDSDKLIDEWIMSRLSSTITQVDENMKNYSLHLALSTLHQFINSDICDIYLETTKRALWSNDLNRIAEARSSLQRVLQPTLVQLSAFMPFVTEYLYERIFAREKGSINFDVVKPSLFIFHRNPELEKVMHLVTALSAATRSLRQKLELSPKLVFRGVLELTGNQDFSVSDIKMLAKDVTPVSGLEVTEIVGSFEKDREYIACPVPGHNCVLWLKIEESSRNAFLESLDKQLEKTKQRKNQFLAKMESYQAIIDNPNTKPSNVQKSRRKLEEFSKSCGKCSRRNR